MFYNISVKELQMLTLIKNGVSKQRLPDSHVNTNIEAVLKFW